MGLRELDRQQWRFNEAVEHVADVLAAEAAERGESAPDDRRRAPWMKAEDPAVVWRRAAEKDVLVALRDGDLHATGRLSTQMGWSSAQPGYCWELHSGYHTPIGPETWRGGRFCGGALTFADGEYIDLRIPRFMVLAIWPPVADPRRAADPDQGYTTPYLTLLAEAIAAHGLSDRNQGKKEALVAWFRERTVNGQPISENLAGAMATLIRLPESQRGGAKRVTWSADRPAAR